MAAGVQFTPSFKIAMAARLASATLIGLAPGGEALAQTPGSLADTVAWSVAAPSPLNVKPGSRVVLRCAAQSSMDGHVYALDQLPGGPIPLRAGLDPTEVAIADGAATGSPSTRAHDPSFDLDTQYYDKDFTLSVPVRIGAKLAAGQQKIPLNVRFQTCNGKTCRPPKTVHLTASVNVQTGG